VRTPESKETTGLSYSVTVSIEFLKKGLKYLDRV